MYNLQRKMEKLREVPICRIFHSYIQNIPYVNSTKTGISKMVFSRYVGRNKTEVKSRRNCYLCKNKYLALSRSNSLPDGISIEQSRDRRYKDITLGTYIEVYHLFKFIILWTEELGLFICWHHSFLSWFHKCTHIPHC